MVIFFLCFFLPLFGGAFSLDVSDWEVVLSNVDPFFWGGLGLGVVVTLSVVGGSWGIMTSGASIMGSCVRTPYVSTKNLISIVFCEAVGVYGLIMSVILVFKFKYLSSKNPYLGVPDAMWVQMQTSGYVLFACGLIVGVGNLACGLAVGICGSSVVLADAGDKTLFVRVLVVEIFASALGIFSIIIGIVFQFKCNFSKYAN